MPQEFQVLQCYSCQTFQVHHVKKTTKWSCKMCGEKQSLKKVFGCGTGAECRQHVQRLNTMRGELVQPMLNTSYTDGDGQSSEGFQITVDDGENIGRNRLNTQNYENTKWNVFVESDDVNEYHNDDDDVYTTCAQKYRSGRKRKRETRGGNPSARSRTKSESHNIGVRDSMEKNGNRYSVSRNNHDLISRMNTFGENESCPLESLTGGIDPESHGLGVGTHYPASGTNHDVQRMDGTGYIIQERKSQEKYSRTTFAHCSLGTKWNTFGTNEPSSLESSAELTKTQLNAFQDKRRNTSSTIKLPMNKYGPFAQSDSSQESYAGEPQDAPDSRPYLTFDPEEARNSGVFDSSSNVAVDTGTISDHGDSKSSVSSSSKWTSFVTNQYGHNSIQEIQPTQAFDKNCAQEDPSKHEFISNETDDAKENSPPENRLNAKLLTFMEGDAITLQCSTRESTTSDVRIDDGSCYKQKTVFKEMKPVFTAGDLEDLDFEL